MTETIYLVYRDTQDDQPQGFQLQADIDEEVVRKRSEFTYPNQRIDYIDQVVAPGHVGGEEWRLFIVCVTREPVSKMQTVVNALEWLREEGQLPE